MQPNFAHLFPTPEGIILAGVIIARRNPDGGFTVEGREKEIHAQLQAAYGRPVAPGAIRYIQRGCEWLSGISDQELQYASYPFHPNPHAAPTSGNPVPVVVKALMMFALTGLNDMPDIVAGRERLLKMQRSLRPDALLKSYGLPTWDELAKDEGDDDDEDIEDDESDSASLGTDEDPETSSGNSHYNPDEPRIPRGQPGGGQWTTAGNGTSTDSGSISADDIRTALRDGFDNYDPSALPQGTQVADNNLVQSDAAAVTYNNTDTTQQSYTMVPVSQTKGASNPANIGSTNPTNVVLADGSTVVDQNGNPMQMPGAVSLNANAAFGESIRYLPSIMTDNDPFSDPLMIGPMVTPDIEASPTITPAKEAAMYLQFNPNQPMDYQRIYSVSNFPDGNPKPNPLYVDFGNYNYGVVASAAGYSLDQALYAAALINARNKGNPYVDTSGPNGSNPTNNAFITQGYNDYKAGKIKASSQ